MMTMRFLKFVPLLALPFLFLGATCVTKVEQKGPTGPWVGEVTNTGSEVQPHLKIHGQMIDADGNLVGPLLGDICPFALAPGEKGYFIAPPPAVASDYSRRGFAQPFHLSPLAVSNGSTGGTFATDVSYDVLQTYPKDRAILVRARNNSPDTYGHLLVCIVNFAPSGEAREIATGSPFLSVAPGAAADFVVSFESPVDGTFQFSADSFASKFDTIIKSPPFNYTTRIVQTDKGRERSIVGEVTNTSSNDLDFSWFQAYLESSPTTRINGFVGTTYPMDQSIVSGNGDIRAGGEGLLAFSLPLDDDDSTVVKLEGIVGQTLSYDVSAIAISNVSMERTRSDAIKLSARLSNPAAEGLNVDSLCFDVRDSAGKLLGGQCQITPWIEPHGTVTVSQEFPLVGTGGIETAEVTAYGHPGPKPHTVVPPT